MAHSLSHWIVSSLFLILCILTYVTSLTIITEAPSGLLTSNLNKSDLANDEEINLPHGGEGSLSQPVHLLDRQPWFAFPSNHQPLLPSQSQPQSSDQPTASESSGNAATFGEVSQNVAIPTTSRNCSYRHGDVFCDCELVHRRFSCYNVASVAEIRRAFEYLLNATRLVYWSLLEVHCVEPLASDEPGDKSSNPGKSFHISYEMFTQGPKFESVLFVGDCSKPKHYDNLVTVDREVVKIAMIKNMLRMATSCSLLQPKFERMTELTLKDCVVAGDMISSTFSTRCLGQYGTRNEPMQLTKLSITSCNISLVESGAFYNFAELEVIDLSYNQISHLSRQAFAPHLYKLRLLQLDHNRLTSLGEEFFEKLPELREVNLAFNRLTMLPGLSPSPGVAQVLSLAENPWDCRCRLTWVLEEPLDSARLITDEPACLTPANVKNLTLFQGLKLVKDTFC